MFSYFQPNFIEKLFWESVFFFQMLAKIEMKRNKNWLFGRHFETVEHFKNFFAELYFFYKPYIWCKFHCKIPVGKWFSQAPLGTNGSESTLVT